MKRGSETPRWAGALQRGNKSVATEYQQRLSGVWTKYDANPFTNMLGGLAQAPIFIGFFSAIRAMAAAKVSHQNRLLYIELPAIAQLCHTGWSGWKTVVLYVEA